jgi:hypothetical protein
MSAIRGREQLRRRLGAIGPRTREAVFKVLQQGGQLIADATAEKIIDGPKSGRLYKSQWRKGAKHRASAPGEAPASDSGRLAQSQTWVGSESTLTVDVGTATPYAADLELGTPDGRIEPRPSLGPSFREIAPRVQRAIVVAAQRAAREK